MTPWEKLYTQFLWAAVVPLLSRKSLIMAWVLVLHGSITTRFRAQVKKR
jgi:hypothetical protein